MTNTTTYICLCGECLHDWDTTNIEDVENCPICDSIEIEIDTLP